ncbi:Chitin deacetylase [Colletotrichum tanaceti]|uniref:Chitin deacetylase n=1 Tax=Colletotrichum tanaceti TaxID=1306861 RepID=A0A4U6XB05_9PEZI|nr:Chitin deacetylase [Colletotrichum tanaceti]KAJ0166233.1 Chitin deacetylase [Colletotrichum tanaceti]TKW52433.1 Chitin deacetylase [Colletotrichum tanaceti]
MHFTTFVASLLAVGPVIGTPSQRHPTHQNSFITNTTSPPLKKHKPPKHEPTQVPYGEAIFSCTEPGTFALTLDDGVFTWTENSFEQFLARNFTVTYFFTGTMLSKLTDHKDLVNRIIKAGDQVGHHTWSHPKLGEVSEEEVVDQMLKLDDAFFQIMGKAPTYMRPPFYDYNQKTLSILKKLKYHVIHGDIDTSDWMYNKPKDDRGAEELREGIERGDTIALCHDVQQNTVEYLLPKFMDMILEAGLKPVTVGECLGDPEYNWYRTEPRKNYLKEKPIKGKGHRKNPIKTETETETTTDGRRSSSKV